jgi:hypothetical protein
MISMFVERSLGDVGSLTDVGRGLLKIVAKIMERKTS